MTVRPPSLLAAALALCLARPLAAQEPAPLAVEGGPAAAAPPTPSANQHVADGIADRLRQSGQLRHYDVDVRVQGGTAELRGAVADQPQREEVLRLAQGVPGVERVVDRLAVGDDISQAQAAAPPPLAEPPAAPVPAPVTAPGGQPAEPLPIYAAPQPGPYDCLDPKMPPYAWPTYAPYNNYSRVAYPEAYPYRSWPFIGPVYPFPKVPLGWRSVKLYWNDGTWLFSCVDTKCDWWRLKYGSSTKFP